MKNEIFNRCLYCGRFISYDDLSNKNKIKSGSELRIYGEYPGEPEYVPEFSHLKCKEKYDSMAKAVGKNCSVCNEIIEYGEGISVDNCYWHKKCDASFLELLQKPRISIKEFFDKSPFQQILEKAYKSSRTG